MEHGENLGARIDRQPQLEHLPGRVEPGANFVQLQVREMQVTEEALVQGLGMFPCASEPSGDGGLTIAEDPLRGGRVESFSQRGQHDCDLLRRSFEAIQGSVTSGRERGAAGLATKGLDRFSLTMLAIPNERMPVCVCDPEVQTLLIWTGEAFGGYVLGCSSPAFHLTPGTYRSRCWPSSRRRREGQVTGGAIIWSAGLEETVEHAALGPAC